MAPASQALILEANLRDRTKLSTPKYFIFLFFPTLYLGGFPKYKNILIVLVLL